MFSYSTTKKMARMFRSRMRKSPLRRKLLRRKRIMRRPVVRRSVRQIHNYKRSYYIPGWVQGSAIADVAFKLEATLSDLPSVSDFTNLYDQYCITGIKFRLIPRFNTAEFQTTSSLPSQIMSVLDYDGNGPSTMAALQQYQNVKVTRGTQAHQRFYKPAVLVAAYQGVTSQAYIPKWNQFVDTGNPSTPQYGLYGIIPQCNVNAIYDLEATYYFRCKQVR